MNFCALHPNCILGSDFCPKNLRCEPETPKNHTNSQWNAQVIFQWGQFMQFQGTPPFGPIVLIRDLSGICELFPKHLKLFPTLLTSLSPNLHRSDSKNPPSPCGDVGKGQRGFHILASTLCTLRFYSWILNNHGSASLLMDDGGI
jgi:hypothetical protein